MLFRNPMRLCNLSFTSHTIRPDRIKLYIDTRRSCNFELRNSECCLFSGGRVELRGYFNAFFPALWSGIAKIRHVVFTASCRGQGTASVWHQDSYGSRMIASQTISVEGVRMAIQLPDASACEQNYLWLVIESEAGLILHDAAVEATGPPRQPVCLKAVICAYKRDTYVENTIQRLCTYEPLQDRSWQVLIVDQGRTLNLDQGDARVRVVQAENRGGSGGFALGMTLAVQDLACTHVLLMDDDVEIEPESIYRTISLMAYSQQDVALAGALLDERNPGLLHELGGIFTTRGRPFRTKARFANRDLTRPAAWLDLSAPAMVDYGGFWYFGLPRESIATAGVPLPLFKKVDDMEYGLRLFEKCNVPVITVPGMGVWHRVFEGEQSPVDTYYYLRNFLIVHAATHRHTNLTMAFWLSMIALRAGLSGDRNRLRAIQLALYDYMSGPGQLHQPSPDQRHNQIGQAVGGGLPLNPIGFFKKLVYFLCSKKEPSYAWQYWVRQHQTRRQ